MVANRESPTLGDAIAGLFSMLLNSPAKNNGDSQAVERGASSKLTEGSEVQLGDLDTTGTTEAGKKVLDSVGNCIGKTADHCWAWADKVYKNAGVIPNVLYTHPKYKKGNPVLSNEELFGKIAPGSWLWIHNGNSSDSNGDHSVIFLGWIDKSKGIAKTASASAGVPGHIDKPRDLVKNYITRIESPIA